ncbi:hypothetical protein P5X00_36520 [Paraburkholderia sp. A2RO-4L]|uniref:hypothetical protein n=1 Tax=Paraburkholderia sp. A2RO-4L TaxID=3028374 RepID=UPI003DAA16EB
MLNRENFIEDWCATLGENRWLTLESVIEYVNSREARLREEFDAAKADAPDTSFDEILIGDTVYVRAGGFRVHQPTGRNLRVYTEEGNPLTQVADLKVETTDALIAELDWCIEEGQSGPRTRAVLKAARKVLDEAKATALHWSNGCDESMPAALRYLADYPRPVGGEQTYNAEHLYQLAGEIESTAKRSRATAAAVVDAVGDIEAIRKRAHAAERGCLRAGLRFDSATGEWAQPAASGKHQPGALYQVGTRVINGMLWTDVDYALYAKKSEQGERNLRIVFENPLPELSKLGDQHRLVVRMAQMAACTCLTKTPDIQYHAEDCRYRLLAEIERALYGARGVSTPTEVQDAGSEENVDADGELLRRVWQSVNSLPYMEGLTTQFAREVLRAYRLARQLPQPLAFFLELRRAVRKAPLGCITAEEIDTLIASSMQGANAAQSDVPLVYRQYHCLHAWAEDDAFWEKQPYGNRFYFGDGAFDYVPRDVLRAFVQRFGLVPSEVAAQV